MYVILLQNKFQCIEYDISNSKIIYKYFHEIYNYLMN